eukprot:GHUV01009556.1.p2 GENE.GHUV01009556.1~~GHUV01009556.1.p2  ORF type:complete len:101 (+),score=15.68 GHUV01009556.1:1046-1348(+)
MIGCAQPHNARWSAAVTMSSWPGGGDSRVIDQHRHKVLSNIELLMLARLGQPSEPADTELKVLGRYTTCIKPSGTDSTVKHFYSTRHEPILNFFHSVHAL